MCVLPQGGRRTTSDGAATLQRKMWRTRTNDGVHTAGLVASSACVPYVIALTLLTLSPHPTCRPPLPLVTRQVRLRFLAHAITRLEEGFKAPPKSTEDAVLDPILTPLDSRLVSFSHLHRQSVLLALPAISRFSSQQIISGNGCRETVFPRSTHSIPRIKSTAVLERRTSNLRITRIGYGHPHTSPPRNDMGTATHSRFQDRSDRVRPLWRTTLRFLPFVCSRPFV